MRKLKTILQSKLFCYSLLIIVVLISIYIANKEHKSLSTSKISGQLIFYKIKDTSLTMDIKDKELVRVVYYFEDKNKENFAFELGDYITVNGKEKELTSNTIPNTFNYKKYLYSKNIYTTFVADKIEIVKKNNNILYKIKNNIIKYVNSFKSRDYLNMFILGDKSYMDEEDLNNFKDAGVSHIFAISGMHVTILTGFLLIILKNKKDFIKYSIVILFLLFYIFLTNYQASILRASFVFIALFINKKLNLELDTINVFLLSISLLIAINVYIILDIGFLYSVTTSYFLINFNYLIKGNYVSKLIKTSSLAFLASLPITVSISYTINVLSIINNLIIVPLISLVIYPASLIVFIFKYADIPFYYITRVINVIGTKLLVLNVIIPKMNIFSIGVYYLLLIIFFISYQKKYIILLLIFMFIIKINYLFDSNYYIYSLDVSQGDSSIIRYKDELIMIDTGGIVSFNKVRKNSTISNNITTFINSLGYSKIKYLILTHGDYDHIGEAINLVNNFKVEEVIFNCGSYNDLEKELIKVLHTKNIKYYSCIKELNMANNKLYFLNTKEYDNENDNSNVIYTEFNNYKFLFMGDASITTEEEILDKYKLSNIDILKVGHHGSNTSSSKEFINSINPKYSLISVGKNNRYGHPNKEVLNNLFNSKIYRTDFDGSVEIQLNKNGYKIKSYNP